MSRLKSNVPNCCEDHEGKELCKHLIGVHCGVRHPNGSWIRVTRDGLELLQQVGCALFIPKIDMEDRPRERCESCIRFEECDFKNDMQGKECKKYMFSGGVLSNKNWT